MGEREVLLREGDDLLRLVRDRQQKLGSGDHRIHRELTSGSGSPARGRLLHRGELKSSTTAGALWCACAQGGGFRT